MLDSGGRAQDQPCTTRPHIAQNVWVHDNTITMVAGQATGAVEDTGDQSIFTANDNRFDANTYRLDPFTGPALSWADAAVGWFRWRGSADGNDVNGRARLVSR